MATHAALGVEFKAECFDFPKRHANGTVAFLETNPNVFDVWLAVNGWSASLENSVQRQNMAGGASQFDISLL